MMNPPIHSWQGLRVWLIGASTGIGAASAKLLLAQGARVALSARSAEKLQAIVESASPNLVDDQAQALVLPLDITQPTIYFTDGTEGQRPNPITNRSSGVGPIPGVEP